MTLSEITRILKEEISKETGLSVDSIQDSSAFYSLGLDSISSVFVLDAVSDRIKVEMNPMFFWDYPTVELLSKHISSLVPHE